MRIGTRLSVWYAGSLFVAMAAVGTIVYYEFGVEPAAAAARPNVAQNGEPEEPDGPYEDFEGILLFVVLPATLFAVGGGWLLTRKALAPVAALTQAAVRVSGGDLKSRLPRSGNGDELDCLAEAFNTMTVRLDDSFQRIREFTLHASHELKTPLTVIRGELEATAGESMQDGPHRERAATLLEEVERLMHIVESLSLLARADAGLVTLAKDGIQLDDLLRSTLEDAQTLGAPTQLRVSIETCESCLVTGDRRRLRQLLLLLVDNAVKYNRIGGTVSLGLRREGAFALCKIANSGPGLLPEFHARVFDRFFRGDLSHSQATEGCGLGLSIAKWIVTAHGGSISFLSEVDKVTTVTVRIPLAAP